MESSTPTRRSFLLAAAAGAISLTAPDARADATAPDPMSPLAKLRPGHPRLVALDSDVARVAALAKTDPEARRQKESLYAQGEKMLATLPVSGTLSGPEASLLSASRECLKRIYTLATLFRLDGDRKWRDRAVAEMLAVSAFADWNPPHFLDTAEMTHAFAIGYDWLYNALTPAERTTIRTALVQSGLRAGEKAYNGDKNGWWRNATHNWNLVCNGGLILGALAVADEESQLAEFIVTAGRKSLPRAMASFAPDGGWAEGPGYWSYSVRYAVPLLAGLRSALGTDFGLASSPGFDRTGTFRLYFMGPNGRTFNYADASERLESTPGVDWLARTFHQPLYSWVGRQGEVDEVNALDFLSYQPSSVTPMTAHAPLDNVFRGVDVVFLRSAWEDPNALWVGFKGGDNAANHSHLDLGTFVFDAFGERWVTCLGADSYGLPNYFGRARDTYYRIRTEGQNTVLLDGANQSPKAKAPLAAYRSRPEDAYAVADLTAGYSATSATNVRRGVALTANRTALLVQDEFAGSAPLAYQWQIHTRAAIKVAGDGRSALLTLNGKTLNAQILDSPRGAAFAEMSAVPPPLNEGKGQQQNANKGYRRLILRLPEKAKEGRIAIRLTPRSADGSTVAVCPLADWIKEAPPLPPLGGNL